MSLSFHAVCTLKCLYMHFAVAWLLCDATARSSEAAGMPFIPCLVRLACGQFTLEFKLCSPCRNDPAVASPGCLACPAVIPVIHQRVAWC